MDADARSVWLSFVTLISSVTTLVCCVLPAVLVAVGAGFVLVGLVSAFPMLVWLSERKLLVFGLAALMLLVSGIALSSARRLPCPADPALAANCERVRRYSLRLYSVSFALTVAGAFAAFALPLLAD